MQMTVHIIITPIQITILNQFCNLIRIENTWQYESRAHVLSDLVIIDLHSSMLVELQSMFYITQLLLHIIFISFVSRKEGQGSSFCK